MNVPTGRPSAAAASKTLARSATYAAAVTGVATRTPTVGVGERSDVGRLGASGAARAIELVGADVDEAARVAVVAALEDRDVPPAGRGPSHPQGELVGLAARVHEVDHPEMGRQGRREPVRIVEDQWVEVTGVRLEDGFLLAAASTTPDGRGRRGPRC